MNGVHKLKTSYVVAKTLNYAVQWVSKTSLLYWRALTVFHSSRVQILVWPWDLGILKSAFTVSENFSICSKKQICNWLMFFKLHWKSQIKRMLKSTPLHLTLVAEIKYVCIVCTYTQGLLKYSWTIMSCFLAKVEGIFQGIVFFLK